MNEEKFHSTPINHEITINSDQSLEEYKRRQREKFIKSRLLHIYKFALGENLIGLNHLDIGAYDGFALPTLAENGGLITSVDFNPDILAKALQDQEIQHLIYKGQLNLLQMDGRSLAFEDESFESVSVVEVLGGLLRASLKKSGTSTEPNNAFCKPS